MSNPLNTHYYDGSLKEQYKKLVEIQNSTTNYLNNIPRNDILFHEINQNLLKLPNTSPKLVHFVQRILQLLSYDLNNNYDSMNDINTLDILSRTWFYVKKKSIEEQVPFYQQLLEIHNGTCAQGRTTRIYQIYYTFF